MDIKKKIKKIEEIRIKDTEFRNTNDKLKIKILNRKE